MGFALCHVLLVIQRRASGVTLLGTRHLGR